MIFAVFPRLHCKNKLNQLPEGKEALLLGKTTEGIKDTLVAAFSTDLSRGVLGLKNQLDTLNRRHNSLGNTT